MHVAGVLAPYVDEALACILPFFSRPFLKIFNIVGNLRCLSKFVSRTAADNDAGYSMGFVALTWDRPSLFYLSCFGVIRCSGSRCDL